MNFVKVICASTLLATFVLREAGGEAARQWLEKIAGGSSATLATSNEEGSWEPEQTGVRAEARGNETVLDGPAYFVQDARKASFFVVSAAVGGKVGLYAVPADHPGVTSRPDHNPSAAVAHSTRPVAPQRKRLRMTAGASIP